METLIKQFIRGSKNRKRGVLVALKDTNGVVRAGYSLCNKKDKFDKKLGEEMAVNRTTYTTPLTIPQSIIIDSTTFHNRAKRYFKVEAIRWGASSAKSIG